jgi:hypothetical protein
VAVGSVEPLKGLHRRWGEAVHFVDVLARQVHPGPAVPPYRSDAQKMADAEAYRRDEAIPWTVLVDDVGGAVHQAYGGLANPAYLIGTDGRVSYYAPTTGAPSLHRAVRKLLAAGGRGVVAGGRDIVPHLLAPFTDGWRAIERGLPQSAAELSAAAPGGVALLRLGARFRPVLAPLTLRAEPLGHRTGVAVAAVVVGALLLSRRRRGPRRPPWGSHRRSSS